MKSVLISIHPKWCELIASGKKTIEVRKTAPKEAPFKAYIYETYDKKYVDIGICWGNGKCFEHGCEKVIGEFVCDDIKTYYADDFVGALDLDGTEITEPKDGEFAYWIPEEKETCLPYVEIIAYGNGKTLYGWHISDLKIYDKPRDLREFRKGGFMTEQQWLAALYPNTHCHYEAWAKRYEITRPPKSWCYVEELL